MMEVSLFLEGREDERKFIERGSGGAMWSTLELITESSCELQSAVAYK